MTLKRLALLEEPQQCEHAFHGPPAMVGMLDGTYDWVCKDCGEETTFTVSNKAVYT